MHMSCMQLKLPENGTAEYGISPVTIHLQFMMSISLHSDWVPFKVD